MMPFMTQPTVAPACYVPGYSIAQSQIFDGDAYLHRVQVAGNRTTWCGHTVFFRNVLGVQQCVFAAHTGNGTIASLDFLADDRLLFGVDIGGSTAHLITKRKFRDLGPLPITWGIETGLGTATDRLRLYVGLERVTDFDVAAYPAQNSPWAVNQADVTLFLGQNTYYNNRFARLTMAPTILLDGIAPDPVLFGEYNIHGVWVPKRPAFTLDQYGPNGFHLDFSDPQTPGKDVSGKGNHFTAAGFDATANVASSPTNRVAKLSVLDTYNGAVISDDGLAVTFPTEIVSGVRADILFDAADVNGYGWEVTPGDNANGHGFFGLKAASEPISSNLSSAGQNVGIGNGGKVYFNGAVMATVGGAIDNGAKVNLWVRGGAVYLAVSGVLYNSGNPIVTGLTGKWAPALGRASSFEKPSYAVNFGQRPFANPLPAGVKTLCTDNLPEPDIKDPSEAFVQVATTGANMEGALAALTGHWNGAPYVEIIKRREVSEDWRVRFSDDPGNAWATNNALAKAAAPALAAAGTYVGYRLRVGARYGVYTAEVPHTTGTVTTVTHGLNTARNVVIATRVSAGGGDRYYRHPDLSAGYLLKLNSNSLALLSGLIF